VRRLRELIETAVPIVGALIIFLALIVISDDNPVLRLGIVVFGILLIEAGVWKLTSPFLPSERKFHDLRQEVNEFILMVRTLNEEALGARASGDAESWKRVHEILTEMHGSVDHMGELAGRTDEENAASTPPPVEP